MEKSINKSIPGVPIPCRAWKNWDYAKKKYVIVNVYVKYL